MKPKTTKTEKKTLDQIKKDLKLSDRKGREFKKLLNKKIAAQEELFEHQRKMQMVIEDRLDTITRAMENFIDGK